MTYKEIKKFVREHSLDNQWWVSIDGVVNSQKMKLTDILKDTACTTADSVYIVNANMADGEHKQWIHFECKITDQASTTFKNTRPPFPIPKKKLTTNTEQNAQYFPKELTLNKPVLERIEQLEHSIQKIENALNELGNIEAMKLELHERERFIEESEERLFNKCMLQELKEVELEQTIDNIAYSLRNEASG